MNSIIYFILVILALTIHIHADESQTGQWEMIERNGETLIYFNPSLPDDGLPSLSGLNEVLASHDKATPFRTVFFGGYFQEDPIVQEELFNEFKTRYPELLEDALKSGGNNHNPKMRALAEKFEECLLATATLGRINEILADHGYRAHSIKFEKFFFQRDAETQTEKLFSIVYLNIETTNEAEEINPQ